MFVKFWIFQFGLLYELNGFAWLARMQASAASTSYPATTCEEFEQGAEFDPNDVVRTLWKIIYFWSETTEINPIMFSLLDSKKLENFKSIVETVSPGWIIDWHKAIFMMEPRPGVQVVFIYADTPGAFRGVVKMEQRGEVRPFSPPFIHLADIRMKQKGEYLGMMCCEDLTVFVMARLDNLPATEQECVAAAATLGLKEPNGRSYFYLRNITRQEL